MDALAGLTFRDTRFLWLLVAAPLLLWWLLQRERLRQDGAARLVSERLRGNSNTVRRLRPWLLALTFIFLVLAAAGPQLGYTTLPVDVNESNRFFLLDVSNSMDARDTGASRLDLARALLQQLVERQSGRVGLIVFEKEATIVSPLTTDTSAVASLLETVRSGETETPGSDLGNAILTAMKNSSSASAEALDLVVVSDGEDQGGGTAAAIAEAKRRGVRVHTVMVGTSAGATIPSENGPLHDESGNEVVTRANAAALATVSSATGGRFFQNPFSASAIAAMDASLQSLSASRSERELRMPIERFEWPLAAGLLALMLAALVHRGAL